MNNPRRQFRASIIDAFQKKNVSIRFTKNVGFHLQYLRCYITDNSTFEVYVCQWLAHEGCFQYSLGTSKKMNNRLREAKWLYNNIYNFTCND